ncbi:MAG TPA: hypothetical protein PKG95_15370, partial [Anaerolineaceae bacterium]|nr:hypothetical protein [Anaerolineaceae bacterium]
MNADASQILAAFCSSPAYADLVADLRAGTLPTPLGLLRAARLPLAAAFHADLQRPILLLSDRMDRALTVVDELGFWTNAPRLLFPEPNPLFYEPAAWGTNTRRDRLSTLTMLARYHIPGAGDPTTPPIIVTTIRALMTRTLPRRDFLKASRILRLGQSVSPESLQRAWVDLGYQPAEVVVEPGQFSRRGGLLDFWPPSEPLPVRLEFFGDEIDTLRRFDPASQRKVESIQQILVTPAREVLPGRAAEKGLPVETLTEFDLPRVHVSPASLLDYLPRESLVLVGDLDLLQSLALELEEQAVRLRAESISEGTLPADFPVPYLNWSELADALSGHPWLAVGHSGVGEPSALAQVFSPGPRYGGRLKPLLDDVAARSRAGESTWIVSRQASRLRELWA